MFAPKKTPGLAAVFASVANLENPQLSPMVLRSDSSQPLCFNPLNLL
jgi:hypothetical protein